MKSQPVIEVHFKGAKPDYETSFSIMDPDSGEPVELTFERCDSFQVFGINRISSKEIHLHLRQVAGTLVSTGDLLIPLKGESGEARGAALKAFFSELYKEEVVVRVRPSVQS